MIPLVAIVGRPNVGKSTLFNRLQGGRSAIVEDRPGVTRDRRYGRARIGEREVHLVDTGGFDPQASEGLEAAILEQTRLAIDEADLVLVLFDAKDGLLGGDRLVVEALRPSGKSVIFVANKVDGPRQEAMAAEFHRLGLPDLVLLSAEHMLGFEELENAVASRLPAPDPEPEAGPGPRPTRLALLGRPNVGKSSLLNRLVGSERSIVSEQPGTTRDPVDAELHTPHGTFVVTDTAGIRRKRSVEDGMERYAVIRALRQISEAEVTCLLLDPVEGVVEQDAKIASLVIEGGKGLVLVFSKSDLVRGREARAALKRAVLDQLGFASFAPLVFLSARTGQGVGQLLGTVARVAAESQRRISTAELNRFLAQVVQAHPPPGRQGHSVHFRYITQPEVSPPTFILSTGGGQDVPETYRRYLLHSLRRAYGFEGVPLRLFFRRRPDRHKKGRPEHA